MNNLGLKHRPTVMYNYIFPLVKNGWLSLTIPDKPNNPKQKYIITEKGKKLYNESKH